MNGETKACDSYAATNAHSHRALIKLKICNEKQKNMYI